MLKKSGILALLFIAAAGLILPTAARAQDGYRYPGDRNYYYDTRSPYNDHREAREWRNHERREWREHERRERRENEWGKHERWEHRYYRDGYRPDTYFYYGR